MIKEENSYAEKEIVKNNSDIAGEIEVLYAIANVYLSMHVLNLVTDKCTEYNTFEHLKPYTGEGIGARKQLYDSMINNTIPEEKERVEEFVDLDTLDERMKGHKMIGEEFIGKHVGWIRARFIAISYTTDGKLEKVIYAVQDINAMKTSMENLLQISTTDELTGLLNRRAYEADLKELLLSASLEDDLAYLSVDVNGLKEANDSFGHEAGDELLRGVSDCMNRVLGPYGRVYRIGGDEFVSLIYTGRRAFLSIREKLLEAVGEWRGNLVNEMAVSLGYALVKENPDASVRELGKIADAMMYREKELYYLNKGVDRRKQQAAYNAICASYYKIVRVNITDDTYQIISTKTADVVSEFGTGYKVSESWKYYINSGLVHPDDMDDFSNNTDLDFLRDYFKMGSKTFSFFYRRKCGEEFRRSMMELIPAPEYTHDSQILYVYVKDIDN